MIGCDCTYPILRFRGVPYHHLLGSVRFVAADRPHTVNPSPVIPAPIPSFLRAYPVISPVYHVIPVAITSFLGLSRHSRVGGNLAVYSQSVFIAVPAPR